MVRVKRGTTKNKSRKSLLKLAKGYRWGRNDKKKLAKQAVIRAHQHSYAHRKDKKADFRRLWQTRINAAVREHGLSYSKFIDTLKKKGFALDRKVLSQIAEQDKEAFARIVDQVKS